MRIVVLGGYGNFGARICRALAPDPGIEVLAAGRRVRSDTPGSRVRGIKVDLASPGFPLALKDLAPGTVIHCAGPFQGQHYRVASAAIAAGAHYIDLADGREFVAKFAEYTDAAARLAGILAVSGASSVPALSSAVIDSLAGRFRQLEEIHIAIAPGQRAPRGAATIAGVFSYAGKPFKWLLLARKLARGEIAARGAFPCVGFLTLLDFEREFARWRISTVVEESEA